MTEVALSESPTTGRAATKRPSPDLVTSLTPKTALFIEYMVFGRRTGPLAGKPCSLEEAARAVGIRLRHARRVTASPIGQKALAEAIHALRSGAKASAMHKIIQLANAEGDGSAAWAKVNLEASRDILGIKDPKSAQVNVQINNTQNVSPGYVIRDPRQAQTIDGTIIDGDD